MESLSGHERVCCCFGKLSRPTSEGPSIFSTGDINDFIPIELLVIGFNCSWLL